jgi:hypothetical protein
MNTYGEVDIWIHVFLTSALVAGEGSVSYPSFTPGERNPVPTEKEAGWVSEIVWMMRRRENS